MSAMRAFSPVLTATVAVTAIAASPVIAAVPTILASAAETAVRSGAAGAEDGRADSSAAVFPKVRGSNLEGDDFTLPEDFEGEINLVFIAFLREQQAEVDTWLPLARELEEAHESLRYYELPTIYEANPALRWFIKNGMRRGIKDPVARARTITLYLDKPRFRKALGLPHEGTIYTLLLDAGGRVLWIADGPLSKAKRLDLERAIKNAIG
jgi:hypothetical protein